MVVTCVDIRPQKVVHVRGFPHFIYRYLRLLNYCESNPIATEDFPNWIRGLVLLSIGELFESCWGSFCWQPLLLSPWGFGDIVMRVVMKWRSLIVFVGFFKMKLILGLGCLGLGSSQRSPRRGLSISPWSSLTSSTVERSFVVSLATWPEELFQCGSPIIRLGVTNRSLQLRSWFLLSKLDNSIYICFGLSLGSPGLSCVFFLSDF